MSLDLRIWHKVKKCFLNELVEISLGTQGVMVYNLDASNPDLEFDLSTTFISLDNTIIFENDLVTDGNDSEIAIVVYNRQLGRFEVVYNLHEWTSRTKSLEKYRFKVVGHTHK